MNDEFFKKKVTKRTTSTSQIIDIDIDIAIEISFIWNRCIHIITL